MFLLLLNRISLLGLILFLFACSPEVKVAYQTEQELGKALFFDATLSRDFSVSCSSCHNPDLAFADSVSISPGFQGKKVNRNSPTLLNVAHNPYFMADGGVKYLASQPLAPIEDSAEMFFSVPQIVYRLKLLPKYEASFEKVYGEVSVSAVLSSLAEYLKTLEYNNCYSNYFEYQDTSCFSEKANLGRRLFFGKAGCGNCHSGKYLTDYKFYKIIDSGDLGRYRISRNTADMGKVKTPTLCAISKTSPYFHNGSMHTLDSAVALSLKYGVENNLAEPLSEAETNQLLEFLKSL